MLLLTAFLVFLSMLQRCSTEAGAAIDSVKSIVFHPNCSLNQSAGCQTLSGWINNVTNSSVVNGTTVILLPGVHLIDPNK